MMKARDFAALNVTIPYKKTRDALSRRGRRAGKADRGGQHDRQRSRPADRQEYGLLRLLVSCWNRPASRFRAERSSCWATAGQRQAVSAVLEDLGAAAVVKVKRRPSPKR